MRSWVRGLPWLLLTLSLALLLTSVVAPRRAETVPLWAARTGLMCQSCHFDPNGGGPRNEFGFAYARNRHMLVPEDSASHWAGLDVTNRVGETMPLYFGVNQRFMLLANQHTGGDDLERLGFFNMESAIHLAFQPHDMLTLVYSLDVPAFGPTNLPLRSREAFGLLGGQGKQAYVKVGRFRNPFGLRMDDHTVATRGGFGELGTGGTFLPYDPRFPDMGVELGGDVGSWYGRVALTNGPANALAPSGNTTVDGRSIKLGFNNAWYQGMVSAYSQSGGGSVPRADRWGYAGMTHYGPLALLGEIAAGTDEHAFNTGKINSLAWFAELNYAPNRWANVRVRVDHQSLDRGRGEPLREQGTFNRYALEGELVPMPFAELRWALRYLDPRDGTDPDERQALLQLHLAY
jgi:hypothetical protein